MDGQGYFKKSIIVVGLLLAVIMILASCSMRQDLYDLHQRSSTGDGDSNGIDIDVGDGLITREDPVTPLSDTFYVKLNSAPTGDAVLGTIQSLSPDEVSVSPSSLTFTTSNWDIPQTVTVTGVDDAIADNVQIAVIDLGLVSGGGFDNFDPGDVTVQNLDDETAGSPAVILMNDGLVTDESGSLNDFFSIVLNGPPAANVTIGTITSTDTGEVTVSPSSLVFTTANWNSPQNVNLGGVDDFLYDGIQMVTVNLGNTTSSDPSWDGMILGSVTAYNLDDDAPKGITVLAGSSNFVGEGNVSQFEVVLDAQPSADVTIGVSSSSPSEATVAPASLTFTTANWNNPQSVMVTGVDDLLADGNQACTINFSAATSGDGEYDGMNPTPGSIPFTVLDNDSAGITVTAGSTLTVSESGTSQSFDVVLNSQPLAAVDIAVTSSDMGEGIITAPASGTLAFTTANWNVAQPVTVQGVDDAVIDGNQPFDVVLGAASSGDTDYNGIDPNDVACVTIDDESNKSILVLAGSSTLVSEGGGFSEFEVVLSGAPTADVTIGVSSSDASEGTVSPASLTFTTVNWSTPKTVQVSGVNDDIQDGNITFSVNFGSATSSDTDYNGQTPAPRTFENIDDDTAGITVRSGSNTLLSETGTSSSFEVVLNSQPTDTVTIGLSSSDTTEGTVSTGSLIFTTGNWDIPQPVQVTGVNDDIQDGNIPFTVDFGSAISTDLFYAGLTPAPVTFENIDDDSVGITIDIGNGLITSESGSTDTFQIVLNSEPTGTVSITISSPVPGEVIVSPTDPLTVNFDSGNWFVPQPVTVTGVDDGLLVDGMQSVILDLGTATSTDGTYNGMVVDPDNDGTVYNVDNDSMKQVIVLANPDGYYTSENGASTQIALVLSGPPADDVILGTGANIIQSTNTNEGTVDVPSLTFTTADWNVPHIVTVTGVDDLLADVPANPQYDIDLGVTSCIGDPTWDGVFGGIVTVTNLDFRAMADYVYSVPAPVTYTPIGGTVINFIAVEYISYPAEDEGYEFVPIGFTFYYMGMPYNEITVYTDGYASFNPYFYNINTYWNSFLIETSVDADIFKNILAPWWDDLDMAGGSVRYKTSGTIPNRVFAIEWENAQYAVSSDETYTFQLVLYETSNIIEFIYGPKIGTTNQSSASAGIKDDVGGDFHFIDAINGERKTTGNPKASDTWDFGSFPADGTVIRFTP